MIPLHGFLEGDTMGLVILAVPEDPVRSLLDKLCASAALRAPPPARARVMYGGRALELGATIASVGFRPLDRFDVVGAAP